LISPRTILSVLLAAALASSHAQKPSAPPAQRNAISPMQRHYEAAYRLQEQGDLVHADEEHTAFLTDALESIATGYANTGDFAHAAPVYDEVLSLAPGDFTIRNNYAHAAIDAIDAAKALEVIQPVLAPGAPPLTSTQKTQAQKIVAEALYAQGHFQPSLNGFLAVTYSDPSYENMYSLAAATLAIRGDIAAKPLFAALLKTYGDSAPHRMDIGRIYGQTNYAEDAVQEFKRALDFDPSFPGAHYSLGAAYMSGNSPPELAEKEFRKELALNPNDSLSYQQLGRIALARNDDHEAELAFRKAIELAPNNVSNYMILASLYYDHLKRPQDAEAAFRRAVELTLNPARNNWEIQRAHYILGRILATRGDQAGAEREFAISQSMLENKSKQDQRISGLEVTADPLAKTRIASSQDIAAFQQFLEHLSPLIAGSYNNLGVHAAMSSQFPIAAQHFQRAAQWNPSLPGVERNWARAAFAAHDCPQAMPPLQRAIERDPSDAELNSILAACRTTR
jgi:tetratricopeptide (TPR) repeat protein